MIDRIMHYETTFVKTLVHLKLKYNEIQGYYNESKGFFTMKLMFLTKP